MSERKDAPKSKFFRLKNDTSRITKNDFDFFKLEEQKSLLDGSDSVVVKTNFAKNPKIDTKQFELYKSGMVGYRYIDENIEKSKIKKDLKSKQTINETCRCDVFNLGNNSDSSIKQKENGKMYGSIGTLTTNYRQFDFMSQTLLEEEIKNLQEKRQKEEQLKSKQQELYNRYKNVHISTQDIKELHKIINEVKSIQDKEKIKTKIKKYDAKYIKLLYLISKLNKEQRKTKLQEKITIDGKIYKYGYCNSNEVFSHVKQSQEAENEQYIGLVFGKESKGNDIIKINNLINQNNSFKSAINSLETEETKLLTNQIDQCKSSIDNLEKQLREIQTRKSIYLN